LDYRFLVIDNKNKVVKLVRDIDLFDNAAPSYMSGTMLNTSILRVGEEVSF
jgi:hypothetical protein